MRKRIVTLATLAMVGVAMMWGACSEDAGGDPADSSITTDSTGPDTDGTDTGTDDTTVADTTEPVAEIPWPGWDNATIYFVITDRFHDGNPANNTAYGRAPDPEGGDVGSFHGGDLAGLTQKLDEGYFAALGVSALWITAPYEQVRGWVSGGGSGFKHYAYHGYFALDFTKLDAAMGTEDELETFVDTAHDQGIRVIFDVVMNHPGYATTADLDEFGVDVLLDGWETATPATLYDFIDFDDADFANWWGPSWVRAELGGGYPVPGPTDQTKTVDFLADFRTESTIEVGLPPILAAKPDTRAVAKPGYTVRKYLVEWLTTWVREYGIDGFRCDTAKHVELASWAALKEGANAALSQWRATNPDKAFPSAEYANPAEPFWMTGEVFPHGVTKDSYYDNGFDSIINFDFQARAGAALADPSSIEATWSDYATRINSDPAFNALSYLSSHDTSLFSERHAANDPEKQKLAGSLLLLTPGAVQIFYGDEVGRKDGPTGGDAGQKTRSDMPFGDNPDVLVHWQTVGRFRKRHPAVGAGAHAKVADAPYAFSRTLGDDVIYGVLAASGSTTVAVSAWPDGTAVVEAMTGATATVAAGAVTFEAGPAGLLLIEEK